MKLYIFLFCGLLSLRLNAQQKIYVSGTITEGNTILEDIRIVLVHKADTILETYSDSKGKYEFATAIIKNEDYEISIPTDDYFASRQIIRVEADWTRYFIVDISVIPRLNENFDNCPHYLLNEVDNFQGFDFKLIKKKISKLTVYHLEFQHLAHPDESEKTLNKRAEHFTQYMISQGIDPSHFHFSEEIKILNFENFPDQMSRITTQIISLEEDCK